MTEQRIVYPDSPFHAIAWRDCLLWAWESPDIRAAFTEQTSVQFPAPAKTPLDVMIDKATGHHKVVINQFIAWFNVTIWGADPYVSGEPVFPDELGISSPTTGEQE